MLFIITFIAAIPAFYVLYDPVLNDPDYIVGAGADTRVFWGALLEVITVIANIGTGSVWQGIATVPEFFWELSLGIYLIVKGFKAVSYHRWSGRGFPGPCGCAVMATVLSGMEKGSALDPGVSIPCDERGALVH